MLLCSDWKSEVVPGLYFLTMEPKLAVYGKVLDLQSGGFLWTVCYHKACSQGEPSKLHNSEITFPLSAWQFRYARQKGWPSNQEELNQILTLPPD